MKPLLPRALAALFLILPAPALAGPQATLEDLAWLEGSWTGPGIGGNPAGETYSAPAGGQIAGHFYQTDGEGGVQFHELITIVPDGQGSLALRLKHFDGDLRGWEQPPADTALHFPLTARDGDTWTFSAVVFDRQAEDRLRITVAMREGADLVFDLSRGN